MLEIRRLRKSRGWNQTELAFHASLAPSVISQVENGKRDPSASTLRKLAKALEVEVGDLFPKVEPPLFDDLVEESKAIGERKRRNEREWWQGLRDLDDFELKGHAEELGNEALRWLGEDPKRWEQAAQRHFLVRLLLQVRADTATEEEKRQLERLVPA